MTLAAIGMVLTSASDENSPVMLVLGVILSLVAVGLMWYAYRVFLWRMERIGSRASERADDPLGPMLISGSLLVALICSAGVTMARNWGST